MPQAGYWESLFDIPLILERMKISKDLNSVVEFGSGYGTFTIPVAEMIKGTIFAFDLEKEMIGFLQARADKSKLKNIVIEQRDLIETGTGLPGNSIDYVMLFNILHHENPSEILRESERILKPSGILGLVHWNYDSKTPRGPKMEIRPRPENLLTLAKKANFTINSNSIDLPPYHYGIIGNKV